MKNGIYGAIIGDMAGEQYEFSDVRKKDTNFELLDDVYQFTDDTAMTCALADALMKARNLKLLQGKSAEHTFKDMFIKSMHTIGNNHINCGFGGMFWGWIYHREKTPYNSFGNGSAMRVCAAGNMFETIDETLDYARWSAEVTHNHEEGIKGAESTAAVMWLVRNEFDKAYIKEYVEEKYNYDLDRTIEQIRPNYHFDVTCQGSVPESIIAFLEGNSYEECVKLAISLGGDTDTQGAITGAMASMLYDIPTDLIDKANEALPKDLLKIAKAFDRFAIK